MHAYKWNPAEYEENSASQHQWATELIRLLELKGSETVIDIGCGNGKITAEIALHLPDGSVLGIDNSEEMIAFARQKYSSEAFPNLYFQTEDARNLSFCDEFTVVFSNAALHWIHDHSPVLHGIFRGLKHGGKILLQMGGKGNAAEIFSVLDRQTESEKWRGYFDGFGFPYGFHSPDEYHVWLKQAGLKPVRVELIPKDMVHENRKKFSGWIRTTWLPYTQQIPKERQEEFIAEIVSEYLKEHPLDAQGRIHIKMMRLEVEAIRS